MVQDYPGPIDVLVTDVVMPRLNRKQLADRLAGLHRDMNTLFVSGNTAKSDLGLTPGHREFLAKPFKAEELIAHVAKLAPAAQPTPCS